MTTRNYKRAVNIPALFAPSQGVIPHIFDYLPGRHTDASSRPIAHLLARCCQLQPAQLLFDSDSYAKQT